MATADSVKAKMQGLIDSANTKTGGNDTTLTAAINALIAGFGSGGGTSGIYMAKITPETDTDSLTITHNLGTTDILLAACWAETMGDIVPSLQSTTLGKIWTKTDIANNRGGTGNSNSISWNGTNSYATMGSPNMSGYWDKVTNENTFTFKRAGSNTNTYFTAGITLTVIIMAASAFSGV